MVDVAQGGSSNEQLPMVMIVPHFVYPEIVSVCHLNIPYNILGFGDLLVPGLLVSFVHSFDLKTKTPFRLYYVVNVICKYLYCIIVFS